MKVPNPLFPSEKNSTHVITQLARPANPIQSSPIFPDLLARSHPPRSPRVYPPILAFCQTPLFSLERVLSPRRALRRLTRMKACVSWSATKFKDALHLKEIREGPSS